MKRLGFPENSINTIWRVLAAILHLGNLKFALGDKEDTDVVNKGVLKKIGSLLEVTSMEEMEESLTGRVIAAHGEVVRKLHNVDDALRARDAFAKVSEIKANILQNQKSLSRYQNLVIRKIDNHQTEDALTVGTVRNYESMNKLHDYKIQARNNVYFHKFY